MVCYTPAKFELNLFSERKTVKVLVCTEFQRYEKDYFCYLTKLLSLSSPYLEIDCDSPPRLTGQVLLKPKVKVPEIDQDDVKRQNKSKSLSGN